MMVRAEAPVLRFAPGLAVEAPAGAETVRADAGRRVADGPAARAVLAADRALLPWELLTEEC
jgi:hypothetical protein